MTLDRLQNGSRALFLTLALAGCRAVDPADAGGGATHGEGARGPDAFLELRHDVRRGALVLRLPPPDERGVCAETLYAVGLTAGLGSNPVGLDRGRIEETRLVRWRRFGERVLVEEENLDFRAAGASSDEERAARESFARSVLWAGAAEEQKDGSLLVDATGFFVRDAAGIAATLRAAGQGSFRLDAERSALEPAGVLAFPDNVEVDALLTFVADDPGPEVRATAPTPEAVTLVLHHSLVRPPDAGYRPRAHDPRSGALAIEYADFAAPLDEPLAKRLAIRHRLRSDAFEPIVYHVDRGAPEPVRSALVEGASWWSAAFEAAGFPGGFRVELLPEDAHPLDARWNVIQWVHRATRGWSYGGGIVDPRTGERVKGHVRLGSQRIRQDRLLFEGLAGVERTGTGAPDDPLGLALARIRQLAAHEVGHAIGLSHDFAASVSDRASVMDYPAPLVRVDSGGELDFSDAYSTGVGAWDVLAIRWLYSEVPDGAAGAAELDAIVRERVARGLLYLSDEDARAPGAAHPLANLWDNGSDPLDELARAVQVRRVALSRFGLGNLARGRPAGELELVLAPVYLHHRYAVDAAAKFVGGMLYAHALVGDGTEGVSPVAGERQRAALDALCALLDPAFLDLPEDVLMLLAPPPPDTAASREAFASRTAPAFDAPGAAASGAELVVSALLQRERCARVVDFHRRDPALPSLEEVLDALFAAAFAEPRGESERLRELRRGVQHVLVSSAIRAAGDPGAAPGVRARVDERLRRLAEEELARPADSAAERAQRASLLAPVRRHLERAAEAAPEPPPADAPPPGSPIGSASALEACSAGG